MAIIGDKLNKILSAVFGKDVRQALYDGLDAINRETETTTAKQQHLEQTFDQLVINAGDSNAEIVDMRVAANGKSYEKAGDRMDFIDSQLADNVQQLTNKINEVATTGTTTEVVQNKITEMAQNGTIVFNTVTPDMTTFIETIEIDNFLSNNDELLGKSWQGGLVNSLGTISTNAEWQTVGIIPIFQNKSYKITGQGVTVQVVYFTDLKNDGVPVTVGWISSSVGYADITIPSEKTYMAINVNSNSKIVGLYRKFQLEIEKEFTMPNLKIESENSNLKGKVIVNFGDSIFGQARPPYDISTKLAVLTGATVYNCGFGGCQMGMHSETKWDAFSMYRVADSIVAKSWTVQDNALALGGQPSYFAETVALLKTIDFNNVDIITISYGTNDFTNGLQPIKAGSGEFKAVATSLQYSIEKIQSAYPNIRIFICTPTYRVWLGSSNEFIEDSNTATHTPWVSEVDDSNCKPHTFLELIQGIKDVAKTNQLPIIDNYYDLGINKYNRLNYFPINDNVHHNQNGRDLIASNMAHKLY